MLELTLAPDQPKDYADVVPGGGVKEKAEQVWMGHQTVQQYRHARPARRGRLVEDGAGAADAPNPRQVGACERGEGGRVGVVRIACGGHARACEREQVGHTAGPMPPPPLSLAMGHEWVDNNNTTAMLTVHGATGGSGEAYGVMPSRAASTTPGKMISGMPAREMASNSAPQSAAVHASISADPATSRKADRKGGPPASSPRLPVATAVTARTSRHPGMW